MDELYISAPAVRRIATELSNRGDRHAALWRAVPPLRPSATGAGFAGHGARLAAGIDRLRERGYINSTRMAEHGPAVADQCGQCARTDADQGEQHSRSSAQIGGVSWPHH
ncbi:hypothetical protein KRX51_02085 [Corynebacterium sp. TAE3-ERU12]|uniref:hypothetical protein n=1 Tax=Corynebacterium sp. TAE3-ERU12 TaxID=2849491 RepID=UPI001C48A311|nr:hypothetical protein [Corynebacterium sp. TAE3-ERU12]MBV7294708.1 hypothetical protein [Corynebacterium sp. TAE3-ERU12]